MSKLRVANFSLSIDGFGAGPAQDLEHPLGENGMELHEWLFDTRTFRKTHGGEGGGTGVDDNFAARGFAGVGAWILGRNMFGPVRGPWPDESWRGWWGETPPFHAPVFVLTHHVRPPLHMQGGTTFTFVTEASVKPSTAPLALLVARTCRSAAVCRPSASICASGLSTSFT